MSCFYCCRFRCQQDKLTINIASERPIMYALTLRIRHLKKIKGITIYSELPNSNERSFPKLKHSFHMFQNCKMVNNFFFVCYWFIFLTIFHIIIRQQPTLHSQCEIYCSPNSHSNKFKKSLNTVLISLCIDSF